MANTYLLIGSRHSLNMTKQIDLLTADFSSEETSILKINEYDSSTLDDIHLFLNQTSLTGSKKILICYNLDECNIKLQNKMLKDIEDNRDDCLQIYTTSTTQKILSTIVSRLISINIQNDSHLEFISNDLEKYSRLFRLTDDDIFYLTNNIEQLDILKEAYIEKDYLNTYFRYTLNKYPREICLMLINVFYIKEQNNINKIKIINDYEQRLDSNAKFELQFETLILKLRG